MALKVSPDEIEQWLKNGIDKTLQGGPMDAKTPEEHVEQIETISNDVKQSDLTMANTYDYEALAQKFKSDAATVQATIEKMEAELRADMPGESDKMYRHFVMHDLGKNMSSGSSMDFMKDKGDQFDGIVLAVSRAKDLNDYPKRLAWKAYAEDANLAISSGKIRIEKLADGTVKKIPLESERTLKDGSPNPKFGQPIEYRRAREILMILMESRLHVKDPSDDSKTIIKTVPGNGELVLVRADVDNVNIGQQSTFIGSMTSNVKGKPYTSVIRGWKDGYEESGAYGNTWALADKLYETYFTEIRKKDAAGVATSENVKKLTLEQINALPSFGYFVTRGSVQGITKSDDGTKVYLSINDDDANRVRASTSYEPLIAVVDELSEHDDVIVIGERASFKTEEGEWATYNILMGVVKNASGSEYADAYKRYAEIRKQKKA